MYFHQNLDISNGKDVEQDFNILNTIYDKSEDPEYNMFKIGNNTNFIKTKKCKYIYIINIYSDTNRGE